jgi:hypothetical protein
MDKLESQQPSSKPFRHRPKFVLIDPLAIDKALLYRIDGKFRIGLILCTEPGPDGKLRVEQAMPSELFRAGKHRSPIVGTWHTLSERWTPEKRRAGRKPTSGQ